jgi:pyroglutamyl-peptidase
LPRLLLTGFEPFAPLPVNPSWELARRFSGHTIHPTEPDPTHLPVQVETVLLPVNWATAWPTLHAAILQVQPDWIILLGLGSTRQVVGVEVRAQNRTHAIRDNTGAMPPREAVEPDGPAVRISTIPAPLVVERLEESGVPAEISTDAGGFLCNWVLYHALAYTADRPEFKAVGFIHIPPLPDQGGPGITLDQLQQGLALALTSLVAEAPSLPSAEVLSAEY